MKQMNQIMKKGTIKRKKAIFLCSVLAGMQITSICGQAATFQGPQSYIEQQQENQQKQEQESLAQIQEEQAVTGWNETVNGWIYRKEDGTKLAQTMTPDGYYVNEDGIWKQEVLDILSLRVTAPETFVSASKMGEWTPVLTGLSYMKEEIAAVMPKNRAFHVYSDVIFYRSVDEKTEAEAEILSLEKGKNGEGYILRLSADLGKRDSDWTKAATYDYEVFRFFCAQISSTPSILADAIYQSWQGKNGYQLDKEQEKAVGDAYVKYGAENGCGVYYISPIFKGN